MTFHIRANNHIVENIKCGEELKNAEKRLKSEIALLHRLGRGFLMDSIMLNCQKSFIKFLRVLIDTRGLLRQSYQRLLDIRVFDRDKKDSGEKTEFCNSSLSIKIHLNTIKVVVLLTTEFHVNIASFGVRRYHLVLSSRNHLAELELRQQRKLIIYIPLIHNSTITIMVMCHTHNLQASPSRLSKLTQ